MGWLYSNDLPLSSQRTFPVALGHSATCHPFLGNVGKDFSGLRNQDFITTMFILCCQILGELSVKATHRKWTEVFICLSCPLGVNQSLWSGPQKQWCSLSQAGHVHFVLKEYKTVTSHITVSYQDSRFQLYLDSLQVDK